MTWDQYIMVAVFFFFASTVKFTCLSRKVELNVIIILLLPADIGAQECRKHQRRSADD